AAPPLPPPRPPPPVVPPAPPALDPPPPSGPGLAVEPHPATASNNRRGTPHRMFARTGSIMHAIRPRELIFPRGFHRRPGSMLHGDVAHFLGPNADLRNGRGRRRGRPR